MYLLQITLAALQAASALAAATPQGRTCATVDPPPELDQQAAVFADQAKEVDIAAAHAPIVINTYFHVVTSTAKQGLYSQTQLNNQVQSPTHDISHPKEGEDEL